jgi:hypothetical protein
MESAIIAAKIFPAAIEQEKWIFDSRDGQLAVRRASSTEI